MFGLKIVFKQFILIAELISLQLSIIWLDDTFQHSSVICRGIAKLNVKTTHK